METSEAIEMLKKGERCPDCDGYLKPNIPYCPACGWRPDERKRNPIISLIGYSVPFIFLAVYISEYFIPNLNIITPFLERIAYSFYDIVLDMKAAQIDKTQMQIMVVLIGSMLFVFGFFFIIIIMRKMDD